MNIENVNTYFNIDEFKKYLDKNPIKKSTILIKGSRSMTLERLTAKL
jgi:UDP-N-acetylmuramyl pentapeptide synthase